MHVKKLRRIALIVVIDNQDAQIAALRKSIGKIDRNRRLSYAALFVDEGYGFHKNQSFRYCSYCESLLYSDER